MDDSSLLSAIQSLRGETPGEKFKNLHLTLNEMVKNQEECENFIQTGITNRVRPGLIPYLQVLVGEKLQKNDSIIAALQSDDVTIIKQALKSKFFFDVSNPILNPEYFVKNIIPNISVCTRRALIKTLGYRLANNPSLSDEFFNNFSALLGFDQTFPLIIACSEQYIEKSIFNRLGIVLPIRILRILYRKYPQLIIQQLKRKKQWQIIYKKFLPELIRNHPVEFVELYERVYEFDNQSIPRYYRMHSTRLGSTRAKSFLKNASEIIVLKPEIFLGLMPLKLVTYKLGTLKFEKMFENFLLKNGCDDSDSFSKRASLLKYYYPEKNKYSFLTSICKKNLLELHGIFENLEFHKIFTDYNEKAKVAKNLLTSHEKKSMQDDHLYYLPPEESIPKLKELINSSEKSRSHWINQMIFSCAIYNNETELLNVLKYYNERHKNERIEILESTLETIIDKFELRDNELGELHYNEIMTMIQRAYVKGDLYSLKPNVYELVMVKLINFFALRYSNHDFRIQMEVSDQCKEIELLAAITLEGYLEGKKKWNFAVKCTKFGKNSCIVKKTILKIFLSVMEKNYGHDHEVWNGFGYKLSICFDLLKTLQECQMQEKEKVLWNLDQNSLSQLKSFIKELINTDFSNLKGFNDEQKLKEFRNLVRKYDPRTYQNWIDENPPQINDVESPDALVLLKRDHGKVQSKCMQYLDSCRKSLASGNKFAKQFVRATKWYTKIPVDFVTQCLKEIEKDGSILILGILLDGTKFEDLARSYLPEDKILDIKDDQSKKIYQLIKNLSNAMNCTNPPVKLDVIMQFCQGDYISLVRQLLINVAKRTPLNVVLRFVNKLVEKPVAVRKVEFQLIFEVVTKNDLQEFLIERSKKKTNRSIRELMVKIILDLFKQVPNEENLQLVINAIDSLTVDNSVMFNRMIDARAINEAYLAQYVKKLVMKIDSFESNKLDKPKLITSLVKNIDENIEKLPNELLDNIVKKYLFDLDIKFVLHKYLSPEVDSFKDRLNTFLEVIDCKVENFNQVDENVPRFYRTKYMVENFIDKLYLSLLQHNHDSRFQIVQQLLSLLESRLEPCEFPHTYIRLFLLREYFETRDEMTLKNFGAKLGKKLVEMIKRIPSECLSNVAENLGNVMMSKKSNEPNDRLDIIEGLMESDNYYGSLIGIYLLSNKNSKDFDERYDSFIKTWRESQSFTIKAVLNVTLR